MSGEHGDFPGCTAGGAERVQHHLCALIEQRAVAFWEAHIVADLQAHANAVEREHHVVTSLTVAVCIVAR